MPAGRKNSSFWFRHRNACLLALLGIYPPSDVVFELGAGNGFVASAFQKAGYPTAALEPSVEGAKNARGRGLETVICATLQAAEFQASSIAAIGMFDVLEHIGEDGPFLAEVARVLAPGGRLYLTVPAYGWLWSDEDRVAGHFQRYTLGRVRRDLERVRITIEYASYFFAPLTAPVFLFRTIPSLLRWGGGPPVSRAAAQHVARPTLSTRALLKALDLELGWLRAARSIPFGTSCVVVARRTAR